MVALGSVAKIVSKSDQMGLSVQNSASESFLNQKNTNSDEKYPDKDPFFSFEDLTASPESWAKQIKRKVLGDLGELMRENRWEDMVALYYPVDEKMPDLVEAEQDVPVREKLAFALGQIQRFDDAIQELLMCVDKEPDNFFVRSSLAYTAYNSLYAAKNRKIFLAGKIRSKRIQLAHENFIKAQELRPDTITNFYRHGMLLSQIENKPDKALPMFRMACSNWEKLSDGEQAQRHQEKKNYIKSLYRLGSLLLQSGDGKGALERVNLCLGLDEKTNYVSLAFKYFALGKVHYKLGNYSEARNALLFANQSTGRESKDFISELLARTYLALGNAEKALKAIEQIPQRFRRPYVRWTEADTLCTMQSFEKAMKVLAQSAEKDGRSRHKSLMRMAKISYLLKDYNATMDYSEKANAFFQGKWGNQYNEGVFWQALAAFRLAQHKKARKLALQVKKNCRFYPKLDNLISMINNHSD